MIEAAFLLAIMGCGETSADCRQVAVAPTRYESQAACLAASEEALLSHSDLAYPVVVAECRQVGVRMAAVRGDEVSLPGQRAMGAVLTASVERR